MKAVERNPPKLDRFSEENNDFKRPQVLNTPNLRCHSSPKSCVLGPFSFIMSAAGIALTAIVAKAGFLAAFAPTVLKIGVMADTFEDHPASGALTAPRVILRFSSGI